MNIVTFNNSPQDIKTTLLEALEELNKGGMNEILIYTHLKDGTFKITKSSGLSRHLTAGILLNMATTVLEVE